MFLWLVNDQNKNINHTFIIKTKCVFVRVWVMMLEQIRHCLHMKQYFCFKEYVGHTNSAQFSSKQEQK